MTFIKLKSENERTFFVNVSMIQCFYQLPDSIYTRIVFSENDFLDVQETPYHIISALGDD